ncbi:MAG: peptidylprolyl isomerase [Vicinamibacterales bacterium]
MRRLIALALVAILWPVAASGRQDRPSPVIVVLETGKGAIEIEVDVARAPVTADNFLRYVDGGFYDGGRFHRTVRPDTETDTANPIQVIQASRARGSGRQGFPPIPLERTSTTGLRHVDGAVSMARVAGRPDSAGSDFFICIGDQPALDFGGARNADGQGFAVFGRVVKGMDVVRAIQAAPVRPGTQTLAEPVAIARAARKR